MQNKITITDVHLGAYTIDVTEKGILCCDIDGTVADLSERRKYLEMKPKNYAGFERGISDDLPIGFVIDAVRVLHNAGWKVIMCSGRREVHKDVTVAWLKKHDVPFDNIYMRREFEYNADGTVKLSKKGQPKPDYRSDFIVKYELLEEIRVYHGEPTVVFDDRDQVVKMWRENGVPCVQVAEGDF